MKKLMVTVALALAVLGVSRVMASDSTTVKGYLMDVSCAMKHAGEDGFAQGHDKECLQMCAKSGFGVLSDDGKFVKFDDEGNKKAEAFIKDTDIDEGWKIAVTGKVSGEKMTVESITLRAQ